MSASLVGSEMCIRDRPTSASTSAGEAARRDVSARASAALRASARHCSAVSYTHLTLPTICSV
eukprot:5931507-Alexandrium_andersonii.AAC.1